MSNEVSSESASAWSTFPRDWWRYLRGPGSFFATQDLMTKETWKRATKYLFLGLGGGVAFSAVNLKFSSYVTDEASKKLFQGKILTHALALGCILTALLSHLIARLMGGRGKFRETYSSFAFTYGFIWLSTALVLIAMGWFVRLSTGLDWTALPPFDVPLSGSLERTPANILIVTVVCTTLLWVLFYTLYCYACAVSASHRLNFVRSSAVVIVVIGSIMFFEAPLVAIAYKLAETLDPIVDWVWKLWGG
jgi:hypothetical protein